MKKLKPDKKIRFNKKLSPRQLKKLEKGIVSAIIIASMIQNGKF